ncbi:SnoaL-like polyketide cyclase [Saccharopolyspora kobensis]|uniref:SnoaL-like polyketide cyclase n=1 Tax=Saccharopolyspora kobensis TaxID=146035 RepID=A0A1H6E7I4_9PSEU|nr:ester cyclase [Saccharopolyspora kobensis]SEG93670.1 SnoaL-like polyketide cyclase [Saccharopolyspora kobensis]SFD46972.1 SnoaL-like polyketide cyclase [Saccharopolyspora kobensis]
MRNQDTHRKLHELFNERRLDEIDHYVGTEFAYIDHPRRGTMHTLAQFEEWLGEWIAGFSDARAIGASYVDGPGFSVAYFHGRGTNDGRLGGRAPTGRQMDMAFCETLRYDEHGRVIGGEIYYDQLTLLNQLGLVEQAAARRA